MSKKQKAIVTILTAILFIAFIVLIPDGETYAVFALLSGILYGAFLQILWSKEIFNL